MYAGLSKLESIKTGSRGLSNLMRPSAVKPSPSGMRTSKSTTSTSFSKANFTAACPEATSPTTLMSELANKLFSPLRTTSWSSAINNRIFVCWVIKNSSRDKKYRNGAKTAFGGVAIPARQRLASPVLRPGHAARRATVRLSLRPRILTIMISSFLAGGKCPARFWGENVPAHRF